MEVKSHNIEFGYELLSAVPYAYQNHLEGKLTKTISGIGSEPLYYFSPKHEIDEKPRSWYNIEHARKGGLPYTFIHRWERPNLVFPPYKEQYKNDIYKWDKPTLVIANRYNKEWGHEPINYFDEQMLEWFFSNLKNQYEIVYIAVDLPKDIQDNETPYLLNDREIAKNHNIKVFQDIKGECWNTSLLEVFANCEHYITMNGGYSILASIFGGTNLVYSKKFSPQAKELIFKSFDRWYPNHANQRVIGCESWAELKTKVKAIYIDKLPTCNIIIRTSNRPNAFARCWKSIEQQDYPNINPIIIVDDKKSAEYTRGIKARVVQIEKPAKAEPKNDPNYGIPFPANTYLKEAQERISDGYICIIDDDDMYNASNAISIIMENCKDDELLVWKAKINGKVMPSDSFNRNIKLYDIGSINFCYHIKHASLTDWSEWKRADYRTARNLSKKLQVKWLDVILAQAQGKSGMGMRIDINQNKRGMKTVRILHPSAGKVGTTKRLPVRIANEVIKNGLAEHIKDVVENLNKVTPPKTEKPLPLENKEHKPKTTKKVVRKSKKND